MRADSRDAEIIVTNPYNAESLELFRLLIEHGPDAVIFADRQGTIRVWNNAASKLFGYTADEAIGRSLDIIIPERLRNAHWKGFERAISRGNTDLSGPAIKTRANHKAGEKRYVTLAFSIIRDRQDEVIGAMATARAFSDEPSV
jgi:PAS domain S-box-containing protein